jgi:hypothetical protein
MLEKSLHTWESIEDGQIWAVVCGEKITIDQAIIVKQFGINVEGAVNVANTLVKEAQVVIKNIVGSDAFVNNKQWSVI